MSSLLLPSIARIEHSIAAYYGFDCLASVCDYLVTREQLCAAIAAAQDYPEWHSAGAVWLDDRTSREELFIAVYFDAQIGQNLTTYDPWQQLNNTNLASFCVLIEEISHFHLLLNKVVRGIALPRLELELQGEIDKILICANLLYHQTGSCYLPPLLQKICDEPHPLASLLYARANDHAATFFYRFLQRAAPVHTHSRNLRDFLQHNYLRPWQEKIGTLLNPLGGKREPGVAARRQIDRYCHNTRLS